jgi:hypothetical protein
MVHACWPRIQKNRLGRWWAAALETCRLAMVEATIGGKLAQCFGTINKVDIQPSNRSEMV